VPDNGGVYLVPAFAGLGAPHWDPYARGTLVGLTRGTNSSHIARAALEGIAFQVADVLKSMEADSGIKLKELRVDGGASLNNLLMQIQADLLGVPVIRPRESETTALGVAFLAGLALKFWKSTKEICQHWNEESRFKPKLSSAKRERAHAIWQKALSRSRSWVE
jgi:glycerol kinase